MDSDSCVSVEILPPNYDIVTEHNSSPMNLPPNYAHASHLNNLANPDEASMEENGVFDVFENIMTSSQMDSQRSSVHVHRMGKSKKSKKRQKPTRLHPGERNPSSQGLPRTAPNSPMTRLTFPLSPLFSMPSSNFLKRRSLMMFRSSTDKSGTTSQSDSVVASAEASTVNSEVNSPDPRFYTPTSAMSREGSSNSHLESVVAKHGSTERFELLPSPEISTQEDAVASDLCNMTDGDEVVDETRNSIDNSPVTFLHHIVSPPSTPHLEFDLAKLMTHQSFRKVSLKNSSFSENLPSKEGTSDNTNRDTSDGRTEYFSSFESLNSAGVGSSRKSSHKSCVKPGTLDENLANDSTFDNISKEVISPNLDGEFNDHRSQVEEEKSEILEDPYHLLETGTQLESANTSKEYLNERNETNIPAENNSNVECIKDFTKSSDKPDYITKETVDPSDNIFNTGNADSSDPLESLVIQNNIPSPITDINNESAQMEHNSQTSLKESDELDTILQQDELETIESLQVQIDQEDDLGLNNNESSIRSPHIQENIIPEARELITQSPSNLASERSISASQNVDQNIKPEEETLEELRNILKNYLQIPSKSIKCQRSFLAIDDDSRKYQKRRRHSYSENIMLGSNSKQLKDDAEDTELKGPIKIRSQTYSSGNSNLYHQPQDIGESHTNEILKSINSEPTKESHDFIQKVMVTLLNIDAIENLKKLIAMENSDNHLSSYEFNYFQQILTMLSHIISSNLTVDQYFQRMNSQHGDIPIADNNTDSICEHCNQNTIRGASIQNSADPKLHSQERSDKAASSDSSPESENTLKERNRFLPPIQWKRGKSLPSIMKKLEEEQEEEEEEEFKSLERAMWRSTITNFNRDRYTGKSIDLTPKTLTEEEEEEIEFARIEKAMRRSMDCTSDRARYTGKDISLVPRKLTEVEEQEFELESIEKAMRRSIDVTTDPARYTGKSVSFVPKKLTEEEEEEQELARIENAMRRSIDATRGPDRYSGKSIPLIPRTLSEEEAEEFELERLENAMRRSIDITSDENRHKGKSVSLVPKPLDPEREKELEFDQIENAMRRSIDVTVDQSRYPLKPDLSTDKKLTLEEEEIELDKFEYNMRKSLDEFESYRHDLGFRRSMDSTGDRGMSDTIFRKGSNNKMNRMKNKFQRVPDLLNLKSEKPKDGTKKNLFRMSVDLGQYLSKPKEDSDDDFDELEKTLSRSMDKTADPNRYKGKRMSLVPKQLNDDEMKEFELDLFEKAIKRSMDCTVDQNRYECNINLIPSPNLETNEDGDSDKSNQEARRSIDEESDTSSHRERGRLNIIRKMSDKREKKAQMVALSDIIEKSIQNTKYSQQFDGKPIPAIPRKLSDQELNELEFEQIDRALRRSADTTSDPKRYKGKELQIVPRELNEEEMKELDFEEIDHALTRSSQITSDPNRYKGKGIQIVPRELNEEEMEELELNELERAFSRSSSISSTQTRYQGKQVSVIPRKLSEAELKEFEFQQFERALDRSFDATFDVNRFEAKKESPPNEDDIERLEEAFKRSSHNLSNSGRYSGKELPFFPPATNPEMNVLNLALIKTLETSSSARSSDEKNPALFGKRTSIFLDNDLEHLAMAIEKSFELTSDPLKFEPSQASSQIFPHSCSELSERDQGGIDIDIDIDVPSNNAQDPSTIIHHNEKLNGSNSPITKSIEKHELKSMLNNIRKILKLKSKIQDQQPSTSTQGQSVVENFIPDDQVERMIELNNLEANLKKSIEITVIQRLQAEEDQRDSLENSVPHSEDGEMYEIERVLKRSLEMRSISDQFETSSKTDAENLPRPIPSSSASYPPLKNEVEDNILNKINLNDKRNSAPQAKKSKIRDKVFSSKRLSWHIKSGPNPNLALGTTQMSHPKGKRYLDFKTNSRKTSSESTPRPKPLQVTLQGVKPAEDVVESNDPDSGLEELENAIQRSLEVTSDPRRFSSNKLPSIISMDSSLSPIDDDFDDLEKALSSSLDRTRDPTRYKSDKLASKNTQTLPNAPYHQYVIKKSIDAAEYYNRIKTNRDKRNTNSFFMKGPRLESEQIAKEIFISQNSKENILRVFEDVLYQSLRTQIKDYGNLLIDSYNFGPLTTSPISYEIPNKEVEDKEHQLDWRETMTSLQLESSASTKNDFSTDSLANESNDETQRNIISSRLSESAPSCSSNGHIDSIDPSSNHSSIQERRQRKSSNEPLPPLTLQFNHMAQLEDHMQRTIDQMSNSAKFKGISRPILAKLALSKIQYLKKNIPLNEEYQRTEDVTGKIYLNPSYEELEELERGIRMSIGIDAMDKKYQPGHEIQQVDEAQEKLEQSIIGLQNPNMMLVPNNQDKTILQFPDSPLSFHSIDSLVVEMNDIKFASVCKANVADIPEFHPDTPESNSQPAQSKSLKKLKKFKSPINKLIDQSAQFTESFEEIDSASSTPRRKKVSLSSVYYTATDQSPRESFSSFNSEIEFDALDQALARAISLTVHETRYSGSRKGKLESNQVTLKRRNSIMIEHVMDDLNHNDELKNKINTKIESVLNGSEPHDLTERQIEMLRESQMEITQAIQDPEFETKCVVEGEIRVGDSIAIFQKDQLLPHEVDSPTVPIDATTSNTIEPNNVRLSTFIIRRDTMPGEDELEVLVQVAVRSREGSLTDQRKSVDSILYH